MRIAVIADLHANLPATEAVLDAVERESPDEVVCLGDLVGYNAQPTEVIALLRERAQVVVAGNHDYDVVCSGPAAMGTNSSAAYVQRWTRERLDDKDLEYLRELPRRHDSDAGFVAIHGSFLNPNHVTGYVTSTMLEANLQAIKENSSGPQTIALCGHTHVPMVGWSVGASMEELPCCPIMNWPPSAQVVLINPGSVGQPRDGDPRSSFMVIDMKQRTIKLQRVAYEVASTAALNREAGLPADLSERLFEGR